MAYGLKPHPKISLLKNKNVLLRTKIGFIEQIWILSNKKDFLQIKKVFYRTKKVFFK